MEFPLYKDDDDSVIMTQVLIVSPRHGIIIIYSTELPRYDEKLLSKEDKILDKIAGHITSKLLKNDNEKCYLVGLEDKSLNERNDDTKFTMEESLTELSELSGAAGLHVIGSTYQRVERPNIEYYIGQGKVKEIAKTMMRNKCCCVVFDTACAVNAFSEVVSPMLNTGSFTVISVELTVVVVPAT